jgi:copper(I)-binding protein
LKTLVLCVAFALMISPATAHAFLEKASPSAGENMNAAPAKVELHFSEALEPAFSGAIVIDSDGRDMSAGASAVSGSRINVPLKKLPPGRYKVSWHAVSTDAHRTEGKYSFTVSSGATSAPSIVVTEAWIRALPGRLPDGGYFTMKNPTAKTVTLTGASSDSCGMLMLHRSDTMSGVSSMSDVSTIDVPAGATLKFAPGGYHLMCMSPAAAIKAGGKITVRLQFADGTSMPLKFAVRGANGH